MTEELDWNRSEPITLGELIQQLEGRDSTQEVRIAFDYLPVRYVESYRGYYEQLAIAYGTAQDKALTVAEVLKDLRAAIGATFQGYKGGDYRMSKSTPLWVANYGECHSTGIIGVEPRSQFTTLLAMRYFD